MKEKFLVCSIAILFGGCPNRHTGPRVVYIPAAPPAAGSAESKPKPQSTEAMVIEVPQPPPPPQVAPPAPAPAPEPEPQPPKRILRNSHSRPNETPPEEEPADIPTLELGETPNQDIALHDEVVKLQQEVKQRIGQVQESRLSRTERNTLSGARAFLEQSVRALQQSDMRRAFNLAYKANLLAEALLPPQ